MSWLTDYRADVRRYTAYSGAGSLTQLLFQQGLWALLQYRLASAVYRSDLPTLPKKVLIGVFVAWRKLVEVVTGICLPSAANIGPGLYLGHFGPIILHPQCQVGANCNLSQGVTLGISGRSGNRGVPVLGDNVYVGANAVLAGAIVVGDGAVVAANSLVTRDVPKDTVVIGVPAVATGQRGSSDYIDGPKDEQVS